MHFTTGAWSRQRDSNAQLDDTNIVRITDYLHNGLEPLVGIEPTTTTLP